jgi:putative membrane protein
MTDKLAFIWRTGWDVHPTLVLAIAGLALSYAIGVLVVGARRRESVTAGQAVLFGLGITVLLLTLNSPLHHLSDDYLFSAHMAQHLLLTLAVPPLLLLGTPGWLIRPSGDLATALSGFGRRFAYPILAFAVFHAVFALVHFPVIYDAVFGSEGLHRLTHVVLLLTAVLTWLPLTSPVPEILPRLGQPSQMLYCFVQTLPGLLVGSLLTLGDRVLYRHYGPKPLELGISPVADQQLGGLLMWVAGGTFWLIVLTVIFFVWADREEARAYQ